MQRLQILRRAFLSSWLGLAALLLIPLLTACPKGDLGAPCNHGRVEPPESKLVTFPALSCDNLLCVYADEAQAPKDPCMPGAQGDAQCNQSDTSKQRFQCVASGTSGVCRLRIDYVLARSMCSKKCNSDSDCKNGGPTKKVVVKNTNCETGFKCARIQSLGQFCCEKLCVCNDDLGNTSELDMNCTNSTQQGCCTGPDVMTVPPQCGHP